MADFDLESYLADGAKNVTAGILRASLSNPRESAYMARCAAAQRAAASRRQQSAAAGRHVPPFLIASITTRCNLHCAGCYARANHSCRDDEAAPGLLSGEQWGELFRQAAELGISFILLAGGEPFLRRDVLEAAARRTEILFPIFTNGTLLGPEDLNLLDRRRNLVPVLSIEGGQSTTDARRGAGVYERLRASMENLRNRGLLFGASVTVTRENLEEVLSDVFLDALFQAGCRGVIYVEYVPIDGLTARLAPGDAERVRCRALLDEARVRRPEMLLVSFPGDERGSGGCLAAGRGFFHINAFGGAEPCPFSPYSDINAADTSLAEALDSPLFLRLREEGELTRPHDGGCALFEQESLVRALLSRS